MKLPDSGLSITHKFFVFLCFLFLLALTDSIIYINKSREIEFYDDLNYRLNDAKFSMIKLEYILDMFVVARHFEKDKFTLITEDVKKVDKSMRELEALGYGKFSEKSLISDGIKYLVEDWHSIKNEFSRLDGVDSYDVILLVHNAVDMNTILFAEKTEKLLADISESRKGIFRDIKLLVGGTLVVSIIMVFAASLFFMFKTLYPFKDMAFAVRKYFEEGEKNIRLREDVSGEAAVFAAAFNSFSDTVAESVEAAERDGAEVAAELEGRKREFSALKDMAETASGSLSMTEIFTSAINGVLLNTGADACAVYMADSDGALVLRASSGIDAALLEEISVISPGERLMDFSGAPGGLIMKDLDEYPDGKLKAFLKYRKFTSLVTAPLPYDKRVVGVLLLEFKEKEVFSEEAAPFIRVAASMLGTISGYLDLFYREHERKAFIERIIDQSPLGLAVFDLDGGAVMINGTLKRMIGVASDEDFIRKYKLFEDNILDREGVFPIIRESYEGLVGECVIDYEPSRLTWYDFDAPPMRLKLRSSPLYDASGAVAGVALLYEEMRAPLKATANA